jgi:hypothetical protein
VIDEEIDNSDDEDEAESITVPEEVEHFIEKVNPTPVNDMPAPPTTVEEFPFSNIVDFQPSRVVDYDPKNRKSSRQVELENKIQDTDELEDMILKAAKHVQTAKEMRAFANEKIAAAIESHSKTPEEKASRWYKSINCIICNFCQNLGLPQLGEHQAGATYYYTPLTINCFGIANVVYKDPTLCVYLYHECEGKKGGNNVASLIMKHIQDMGWDNAMRDEINIIMDNCAGQNKNRMVLRLSPLLVEMGWYCKVNMIFLVAGHTKNAADRLFNLLKKEYRERNVYNMEQLVERLNDHELIEAIKVGEEDFRDWDLFLNSIYNPLPPGFIQPYQFFHSDFWREGWIQAQVSAKRASYGVNVNIKNDMDPTERKALLKQNPWVTKNIVAKLEPPGIRAIKQVEMYEKWRKFVPVAFLTELYAKPHDDTVKEMKDDKKKKKGIASTTPVQDDWAVATAASVIAVPKKVPPKKRLQRRKLWPQESHVQSKL